MNARVLFVMAIVTAAGTARLAQQRQEGTFKVANWNVRSGMGIAGKKNPQINSDTTDCTQNASKPGGPFWPALDTVKNDSEIVALGVQEAWACATPEKMREYLGWKEATPERNGTALIARYGLRTKHLTEQVAFSQVEGASEDQWIFGGDVCLAAACEEHNHLRQVAALLRSQHHRRRPELLYGEPHVGPVRNHARHLAAGRSVRIGRLR
jgi:hypothetical protein